MKKLTIALIALLATSRFLLADGDIVDVHHFEFKGKTESLSQTVLNLKETYKRQTQDDLHIYLAPELTVEEKKGRLDLSSKNLELDKCVAYICKSYNLSYNKIGEVYFIHPPRMVHQLRSKIQPVGAGQPM